VNYSRPELGERLAADYVLGLMPRRARRRFERAMGGNATLAATVAAWSDRLAPLDSITAAEAPPANVWPAIERRIGPGAARPATRRVPAFWQFFAATAIAAGVALAVFVVLNPAPLPNLVAALADRIGLSGWVEAAKHAPADIGLSTMRLGIPERERPRWLRAALLLTDQALPIANELPPPSR